MTQVLDIPCLRFVDSKKKKRLTVLLGSERVATRIEPSSEHGTFPSPAIDATLQKLNKKKFILSSGMGWLWLRTKW